MIICALAARAVIATLTESTLMVNRMSIVEAVLHSSHVFQIAFLDDQEYFQKSTDVYVHPVWGYFPFKILSAKRQS